MRWRYIAATFVTSASCMVAVATAQLAPDAGGGSGDFGPKVRDSRGEAGREPGRASRSDIQGGVVQAEQPGAPVAEPVAPDATIRKNDVAPQAPPRPDLTNPAPTTDVNAPAPPAPDQNTTANTNGVEELTRGPIHESFAEPVPLNVEPSLTVPKQPPALIHEIPPETRPEGNAEWIPGYWGWDNDRNDFIWISGLWRIPPYGHRWVPGHWMQAADGYTWVGGFWNSTANNEVTYLPAPPETLDQGPQTEAPSDDYFWVPGNWVYENSDYAWRPGYWARSYPNWMWVPNHYAWTPEGAIFVNGYWDYPIDRRGMLFAPAYFTSPIYNDPGYWYTPTVAVNVAGLQFYLFSRPRYQHYYFGDYYDASYLGAGFYPWFAYNDWRGYDPFYYYFRSRFGGHDRDWDHRYRDRYQWYRDHKDERPAHTFAEMHRRNHNLDNDRYNEVVTAINLRNAVDNDKLRSHLTARKFTNVAENQRRQIGQQAMDDEKSLRDRRVDIEKQAHAGKGAATRLMLPQTTRTAGREGREGARDGRDATQPTLGNQNPNNAGNQNPATPFRRGGQNNNPPPQRRQLPIEQPNPGHSKPDVGKVNPPAVPNAGQQGQPPANPGAKGPQRRALPNNAPGPKPAAGKQQGNPHQENPKQSQRPRRERSAQRELNIVPRGAVLDDGAGRSEPTTRPDVQGSRRTVQPEARGLQRREQPGRPGRAESGARNMKKAPESRERPRDRGAKKVESTEPAPKADKDDEKK